VPEGKHVAAVYSSGPGGALAGNIEGKTFIECSTIDIQTSTRISDDVQQRGGAFVDCPVSGGTSGAEAGTITFMVGAEREDPLFDTITPILHTMGTNIISCGGPTLGLATKLCNNYISGTIAIATAEGMNLAVRLGLDPKVFSQALSVSTGGSWVNCEFSNLLRSLTTSTLQRKSLHVNHPLRLQPVPGVVAKAPASHDYAPGFKTELMRKDYNLAVDAAHSVGARLVLGPVGLQTFTDMSLDPRCSGKDCRVVYRYLGGRE
jgi:3-hydroxyisobutyrate dehydrogenase-like beta-hydroxyacid dehydrogenase